MQTLVDALHELGHCVVPWRRAPRVEGPADWIIWWGCNVSAALLKSAKTRRIKPLYLERGWTRDRDQCFQLDRRGVGGLASWSEESLSAGCSDVMLPVPDGEYLLVVLRFERPFQTTDNAELLSPYFRDNIEWVRFLRLNSVLPLLLRAHPDTSPVQLNAISAAIAQPISCPRTTFEEDCSKARAVAVIDSTAGVHAMEMKIPVLCYGRQVYRHPGVVHCLTAERAETRAVTRNIAAGESHLDTGRIQAMLTKIRTKQFYACDAATFPDRFRQELGL